MSRIFVNDVKGDYLKVLAQISIGDKLVNTDTLIPVIHLGKLIENMPPMTIKGTAGRFSNDVFFPHSRMEQDRFWVQPREYIVAVESFVFPESVSISYSDKFYLRQAIDGIDEERCSSGTGEISFAAMGNRLDLFVGIRPFKNKSDCQNVYQSIASGFEGVTVRTVVDGFEGKMAE